MSLIWPNKQSSYFLILQNNISHFLQLEGPSTTKIEELNYESSIHARTSSPNLASSDNLA
jgi:hypothetical protein